MVEAVGQTEARYVLTGVKLERRRIDRRAERGAALLDQGRNRGVEAGQVKPGGEAHDQKAAGDCATPSYGAPDAARAPELALSTRHPILPATVYRAGSRAPCQNETGRREPGP